MSLITLTTDFGTKDHFVGAMKGAIFTELINAKVVDISHQISPFNITETAYILKNVYKNFPKGSIHIIDVDSELSVENKHIAVALDGHFFICADNGIISMIAAEIKPDKMVEITIHNTLTSSSAFVKVACHIARGGKLEVVGRLISEFKQLNEVYPSINKENDKIVGTVIYIDNYGNIICNITKKLFKEVGKGRNFEVSARNYTFKKVFQKYNEIINFEVVQEKRQYDGEKLALFNASDYLEIAVYKSNLKTVGGASTLLGINYRDSITVSFL